MCDEDDEDNQDYEDDSYDFEDDGDEGKISFFFYSLKKKDDKVVQS